MICSLEGADEEKAKTLKILPMHEFGSIIGSVLAHLCAWMEDCDNPDGALMPTTPTKGLSVCAPRYILTFVIGGILTSRKASLRSYVVVVIQIPTATNHSDSSSPKTTPFSTLA